MIRMWFCGVAYYVIIEYIIPPQTRIYLIIEAPRLHRAWGGGVGFRVEGVGMIRIGFRDVGIWRSTALLQL